MRRAFGVSGTVTDFFSPCRCKKRLFSSFVCNGLHSRLNLAQPEDQGSSWRSCQTLDHLAAYKLTGEHAENGCQNVATVDFMKVFDSISNKSLRNALGQCGNETQHINLLKKLHAKQKTTVSTDKESSK